MENDFTKAQIWTSYTVLLIIGVVIVASFIYWLLVVGGLL